MTEGDLSRDEAFAAAEILIREVDAVRGDATLSPEDRADRVASLKQRIRELRQISGPRVVKVSVGKRPNQD